MAKSIYETLESLSTETSVPGEGMVPHSLPRELLPTDKQFESADELLTWAKDLGIVHSCLQKGVKQMIIDLRAIFKACKKDETWSLASGQAAVNAATWNITSRPNVNTKEAVKRQATIEANTATAQAMRDNGVDDVTILAILTTSCGADLAKEILENL